MKRKSLLLSTLLILLTSCEPQQSFYTHQVLGDYYEGIGYLSPLNTSITLKMFDKEIFDQVVLEFDNTIKNLSKEVDRYNNYEGINNLKLVNESFGKEIIISNELFELLQLSIDLTKLSGGNFHMAMGTIIDLYEEQFNDENIGTIQKLPLQSELDYAISCIPNYDIIDDYIVLNKENNSVTLYPYNGKEFIISLGAIAKGYVMQKAYDYLTNFDAPFIFDAGSSTVAISGNNPLRENGKWNVGFKNPILNSQDLLLTTSVDGDTFISTSGDYQKYFFYDDENIMHHILDVYTGVSNNYYNSISLISKNASLGLLDAMSTALFNIESIDESLALLDKIEDTFNCDISFAFTSKEDNNLSAIISENFNKLINGNISNSIKQKKIINNY